MKKLIMLCLLVSACGKDVSHTKIKEVCSDDSPGFMLPDEVVCNHAPANNIEVKGQQIVYMCTKIKGE